MRGEPRDSPIQAFRNADTGARVEAVFACVSFGFAVATVVVVATAFGKATACELTCAYIAAGVFEIVGILITVHALIEPRPPQGMVFTPGFWAKWRGPAFIITGIVLGCLGNIESLHLQAHSPVPLAPPSALRYPLRTPDNATTPRNRAPAPERCDRKPSTAGEFSAFFDCWQIPRRGGFHCR